MCEKVGRELYGNPRAITAGTIGINATAVRQAPKTLEGLCDNAVGCWSIKVRNKSNTARVVLFTLIKALLASSSPFIIHKPVFRHLSRPVKPYFATRYPVLRNE